MIPLRHNRDFVLLQAGQLLSNLGTASTTIAYPLLVLALTHSPAKAGVVGFARAAPLAVLQIPAGIAADRFDRKWLMIAADFVRAVAIGSLVLAIATGHASFAVIPIVALVEGMGDAIFAAAQPGALRSVVPTQQLPDAATTQTGRSAAVDLVGPPVGGALFGIARSLPFFADVVSYALSTGSLLLMRTPFQEERERQTTTVTSRMREGFRFLWTQPFLRTTTLLFGLGNFIGPGLLLAIVVIAKRQGVTPAVIGALTAAFGAAIVVGAILSGFVRRRLPPRTTLLLEFWAGVSIFIFLLWPNVYVLVVAVLPTAFVIPSSNAIVHGYRIAMTPDALLGRSESIRMAISLAIAPIGPLAAGFMLDATSARATVALFGGVALALAVSGTFSRALRDIPSLEDLEP